MKLVIQIPSFNEAEVLGETLASLPRQIEGFSEVVWFVIDDGSSDDTARVAAEAGADRVVRLGVHRGLATAFAVGLRAALGAGADVIVNTDADFQYRSEDIPKLVRPILENRAEIVIGERMNRHRFERSLSKRVLSTVGNAIVRWVSGIDIADAPSGFRALSREAAARINIFSRYSYTLEMVIQAGRLGIPLVTVPVEINPPKRPSRLMRNVAHYVFRSGLTVIRIGLIYKPAFTLGLAGVFLLMLGIGLLAVECLFPSLRTLLLGLGFMIFGFQSVLTGVLANLMAVNRRLSEELVAASRISEGTD